MASFFITGNSTTAQTLAAGENGFVTTNGTLYTETATAVTITGSSSLAVMGTVATAEASAAVRTSGTVGSVSMTVGAQGSVLSTTTDAIRLAVSGDFRLTNAGMISGYTGLFVTGDTAQGNAEIQNTGTIISTGSDSLFEAAILLDTTVDRGYINNSGRIQALVPAYAIYTRCEDTWIENSGEIISLFAITATSDLNLLNTGTIAGQISYFASINLRNTGTITGDISRAFDSEPGASQIYNAGLIQGFIAFGSSNDFFENVGGTVTGQILGGGGNDIFTIDRGDLRISGGEGTDTVISTASYRMGTGIEVLNLQGATGLTGIGRDGNESITGGDGNDTLFGRSGNDTLNGGEGDDLLRGGLGNDLLLMSDGNDTLAGGGGIDTLSAAAETNRLTINLATGNASVTDAAGELLHGASLTGIENATGGAGSDSITGTNGDNLLQGNGGVDTLSGGDGNDTLSGGADADSLSGGKGIDVLIGGAGRDTMVGGSGPDTFEFFATTDSSAGAADLITDFGVNVDLINLSGVDADLVAGGDQAFVFVGTAAFAGPGAQVRFQQDAGTGTTTVQLRLAGSAVTDMEIALTGLINLTVANFDL